MDNPILDAEAKTDPGHCKHEEAKLIQTPGQEEESKYVPPVIYIPPSLMDNQLGMSQELQLDTRKWRV
jgi:hypothetical protein